MCNLWSVAIVNDILRPWDEGGPGEVRPSISPGGGGPGPRLCLLVPLWTCAVQLQNWASPGFPVPCFVGLSTIYQMPEAAASVCHPYVLFECSELWKPFQSFQVSHCNFQCWLLVGENVLLYLKGLYMSCKPKTQKQTNCFYFSFDRSTNMYCPGSVLAAWDISVSKQTALPSWTSHSRWGVRGRERDPK